MKRRIRSGLGAALVLGVCNVEAVEFNLFGDTQLVKRGENIGFNLGALDLSVEHNVSNTSVVTADMLFERGEHGFEIEIERLKITRELTPTLNFSMGRMVSGQGFWQQTFHHGSLSQDTVTLPFFLENLERHDGIITAHATGAALAGKWGSFSSFLSLTNPGGIDTNPSEVGHGLSLVDLDHVASGRYLTQLLRLAYSPNWKSEIGILVENKPVIELADKDQVIHQTAAVDCANTPPQDRSEVATGDLLFRVLRSGLDYYYNGDTFYTYVEYSHLKVHDGDFLLHCYVPNSSDDIANEPQAYSANAYYVQFGYRYNSELAFTLRHEGLSIADEATLYEITDWHTQTRDVFAMSYRFDASNALRLEYNKTRYSNHGDVGDEALDDYSEFRVQWFFLVL